MNDRQLCQEGVRLPNGNALPSLFEFTELELSANPRLASFLPGGAANDRKAAGSEAAASASAAGTVAPSVDGAAGSGDEETGRAKKAAGLEASPP